MKLLSLNIWGGRVYPGILDYLEKTASGFDIYCFQEVFDTKEDITKSHEARADIWQKLSEIFPDYHRFYYPAMAGYDSSGPVPYDLTTGLGMFVKENITVKGEGDYFTYRRRFAPVQSDIKDQPVNLQYVNLEKGGQPLHVYNFHGIWYPGEKLDTPERIDQSKRLISFMGSHKGSKILCGDFNLMPQTKSVTLLEEKMKNLVREFNIRTTRSKLNPYRGTAFEQEFADYVFVSNEVRVVAFSVPEVEVSDHLPMILEFEM